MRQRAQEEVVQAGDVPRASSGQQETLVDKPREIQQEDKFQQTHQEAKRNKQKGEALTRFRQGRNDVRMRKSEDKARKKEEKKRVRKRRASDELRSDKETTAVQGSEAPVEDQHSVVPATVPEAVAQAGSGLEDATVEPTTRVAAASTSAAEVRLDDIPPIDSSSTELSEVAANKSIPSQEQAEQNVANDQISETSTEVIAAQNEPTKAEQKKDQDSAHTQKDLQSLVVASGRLIPKIRRVPWFRVTVLTLLAALVIGGGIFSWNRWLRFDDGADIQGEWVYAGGPNQLTVNFSADEMQLTKDARFHYTIDTFQKTLHYTFADMQGSACYAFSDDRQTLVIADERQADLATILGFVNLADTTADTQGSGTVIVLQRLSAAPSPVNPAPSSATPSVESSVASSETQPSVAQEGTLEQDLDNLGSDPGVQAGENVVTPEDLGITLEATG